MEQLPYYTLVPGEVALSDTREWFNQLIPLDLKRYMEFNRSISLYLGVTILAFYKN